MSKLRNLFSKGSAYSCPFCGTKLSKDELFCGNCGQPRENAPAYEEPEYVEPEYAEPTGPVCAACGNPMEEGDIFCMNCGTRRSDTQAEPVFEEPSPFVEEVPFKEEAPAFTETSTTFFTADEPAPFRKAEEEPPKPHVPAHLRVTFDAAPIEPRPNETADAVFMAASEAKLAAEEAVEEEPVVEEPVAEEPVVDGNDVTAEASESASLFDSIDEASIWGRPAEEPVAEEMPAVEEEIIAEEEPATEEAVIAEEPVIEETPAAEEEAAYEKPEPPVMRENVQVTMYGLKFLAEPMRDVCILRSGAIIGRLATCSLVIDEPSVSRRHCHIDFVNGQWQIVVLGVNGMVIDGEHYTNEYGRPIPLYDGCVLEFPGMNANTPVQFIANPF